MSQLTVCATRMRDCEVWWAFDVVGRAWRAARGRTSAGLFPQAEHPPDVFPSLQTSLLDRLRSKARGLIAQNCSRTFPDFAQPSARSHSAESPVERAKMEASIKSQMPANAQRLHAALSA